MSLNCLQWIEGCSFKEIKMSSRVRFGASTVAADIALGGQLANLITNNGAPIAADSAGFNAFFADLGRDLSGLRRARLDAKLRTAKAEAMVKRGESVSEVEALTITPAEYPALLEQVYREERIDKPRNAIGLAKSLPMAEMERLLLESNPVSESDLRALANRRANLVRDWLLSEGKLPLSRIFVLEPRLTDVAKDAGVQPARVDFSLK